MGIIEIRGASGIGLQSTAAPAVALSGLASAQQPSALSNLAYANQVASNDLSAKSQIARQDAMNRLRHSVVASAVARIQGLGPLATRSAVTALTGNEGAESLGGLKGAISAFSSRHAAAIPGRRDPP
ncbi:hypothetical protein [Acidovorax sp. SUPP3334]|uniref:hypothetical protein n=1 Tax=Acidovorax sp. SUPP3334 TaxID=2920881 RepID=UPI0024E04257|nr:hypothetical protein [Acidovorax sp. SUPP3334]